MLGAHTLLIAAIFVPYVVLMTALGAYIYRTGQPRNQDRGEDGEDDGEPIASTL